MKSLSMLQRFGQVVLTLVVLITVSVALACRGAEDSATKEGKASGEQPSSSSAVSNEDEESGVAAYEALADEYEAMAKMYEEGESDAPDAMMRQYQRRMHGLRDQMRGVQRGMMEFQASGGQGSRGRHEGSGRRHGMGRHGSDSMGPHMGMMRYMGGPRPMSMWHGQMMQMHEQMQQWHLEHNQADMAEQHGQMASRHRDFSDRFGSEAPDEYEEAESPDGARGYSFNCAGCHGPEGKGLSPAFPPLADSEWVTGDPSIPIRVVLHGVQGELQVAGQTYHGAMPGFGGQLSDESIASILTFVRSAWGNSASAVGQEEVEGIREQFAGRAFAWPAEELLTGD